MLLMCWCVLMDSFLWGRKECRKNKAEQTQPPGSPGVGAVRVHGIWGRTDKKQVDKQTNKPECNHEKNFRGTQLGGPSAKYLTGFSALVKIIRDRETSKKLSHPKGPEETGRRQMIRFLDEILEQEKVMQRQLARLIS